MLKNNMKRFISLCIALLMSLSCVAVASAAEATPSAEEVFPVEQVKELQEQNANQPIYNDKDANDNLQINRTRSTGTYPTRKGVILVTDDYYKNLIPTGHAAIVYSKDTVVESVADGVILGKNNWNTSKTTCTAVTVLGTTAAEDAAAADWCYKQIGKKYNLNYLNTKTRDKFYCSQLVWAAFLDNYDIDLNTSKFLNAVHPAELVDSENTRTVYTK